MVTKFQCSMTRLFRFHAVSTRLEWVQSEVLSRAKMYLKARGARWFKKMSTPFQKQGELRAVPIVEEKNAGEKEEQHKLRARDDDTVQIEEKRAGDEERPVTIIDQAKAKQIATKRVNKGQHEAEAFETNECKHD